MPEQTAPTTDQVQGTQSIFTAPSDPVYKPPMDRSRLAWRRWEFHCLIHGLGCDGMQIAEVAEILHRSVDSVRREYERLLANPDKCPPEIRSNLLDLIQIHKAAIAVRKAHTSVSEDQATAQYKSLSNRLNVVAANAAQDRAARRVLLALHVAAGTLTAAMLQRVLPLAECYAINALARDIRNAGAAPRDPSDRQIEQAAMRDALDQDDPFDTLS